MINTSTVGDRKLKVFISYSRKDEDFAQELLSGLQLSGFEPYLDKHDIAAGEDWEARLGGQGIALAFIEGLNLRGIVALIVDFERRA